MEPNHAAGGTDPKVVGIISYLTLIGWIAAIIMNSSHKSSFGSFHIRQSLGILLLAVVSNFVMIIPILGWIAGLAGLLFAVVLWFIGFISAIQGEEKLVPVLGPQFQEWFKSL